tara:strand:- start:551 stop:1714 length:1164 start_codon:yes stop_codon:yes gene_type:complete
MPVNVGAGSSAIQISGGHSSHPTGGSAGDLYYHTGLNAWHYYDGSTSDFVKISRGALGESDNPGGSGAMIYADGDRTDGVKYIRTTAADPSALNTNIYQTYCLLSDDSKWGGTGGWTLAAHIPFSSTSWRVSGSFSSSNHYFSWDLWERTAPHHYSGSGEFDYSNPCLAIGYFIPFDDIMIMTYDSSTSSFLNPGATATYSRNSGNSKESLYKIQTTRSDYVWSAGGRQSIYRSGNISNSVPTWNTDRTQQGFTGNPWTNNGNTYGGTGSGVGFNSYNLVFKTSAGGSYSSDATGNRTRITTTMVNNSNTGNDYPHTMQHGLGSYHNHGGYEGTSSYVLGQASYCQMTRDHVPANDHYGGWNSDVFCTFKSSPGPTSSVTGWSIWTK